MNSGSHSPRFAFFTERQVGIGSAAQAIEPYLRRAGHAWFDVTYQQPGGWLEQLPYQGRAKGTLRGYLQVRDGLSQGPFDGLFFLTHNPAVFHHQLLTKVPTVIWTDVTPEKLDEQAEHYGHPRDRARLVQKFKRHMVKRTFEAARRCLAWSEWARDSFVSDYGIPAERTGVVHPGIDLERFQFRERVARPIPRFLFVGGDFARKGGPLLLEVFRSHFRGQIELDLVTRDPVPEEPGVRVHHGMTAGSPQLLDLFAQASAFVLPTLGDCFSIASMEAMAMGLPVLVSRVGGIADIVEPGASGYLFAPGDGRALKEAIEEMIQRPDLSQNFGRRGRAIVSEKFNAEKTAAALIRHLAEAEAQS